MLAEHLACLTIDRLQDGPDSEGRKSSYFPSDLLMNHRDPILDSDVARSRNSLVYPDSPHDPAVGSYGTRDPEHRNHSQLSLCQPGIVSIRLRHHLVLRRMVLPHDLIWQMYPSYPQY